MDASEFGKHLGDITHAGYIVVAVGLGHELGLFDLLMKENRPMTSQEIADARGMRERYVREWLGSMTSSKIIVLNPDTERYSIPEEHHAVIKGTTPWATGVTAICSRQEDVKKCFMKDGPYGIDYNHDDEYWCFLGGVRSRSTGGFVDNVLIPQLNIEGIVAKLEKGISVIDIGCGTGQLSIEYAKRFPKSIFTGFELADKPIALAHKNTSLAGLSNLSLMKGDVYSIPESLKESFDLVILYDCLHDLPDPDKALCEIQKVIKSDGFLSIIEFRPHSKQSDNVGDSTAAMLYTFSTFVCLPSSMTAEPRIGYGVCWGYEKMRTSIMEHFNIVAEHELPMLEIHFICTKK